MGGRRRTTINAATAPDTEGRPPDAESPEARLEASPLLETASGTPSDVASYGPAWSVSSLWSRTQAIIGLVTGLLSIAGAIYSGASYLLAPKQGEMAALVRESRTDRPLGDATVEVLTSDDTLVTTLAPAADGWTRHSLRAGTYRIRVSRPGFGSDTKPIQVLPGRSVEVRFQLTPRRGGSSADNGGRGSAGPVSRFLGRLGL